MKYIATDCDGVLLNWKDEFKQWMKHHGYEIMMPEAESYWLHDLYGITHREIAKLISYFNSSARMGFLKSYKDSDEYVKKLAEDEYKFLCVTCLGPDKYAQELRKRNLNDVFGEVFEAVICLDYRKRKGPVLEKLKESYDIGWWLEDHTSQALEGQNLGIPTIIFDASYNKDFVGHRAADWKEAYDMIKGFG